MRDFNQYSSRSFLPQWLNVTNRATLMPLGSIIVLVAFVFLMPFNQGPPQEPAGPQNPALAAALIDPQVGPSQEDGEDPEGEEGEGEGSISLANTALTEVVVARVPIPLGERLRAELLEVQLRPVDNVAVRAGVTVGSIEDVDGRIVKTDIAAGQEILTPMIALSSTDLATMGSDLALHIDNGKVAVAFPINQFSGAAYAMRPGDFVDVLMSFNVVELDIEFQTPLPNLTAVVDQDALLNNEEFLFPAISQGRLELIPEIDKVAEITPQGIAPAAEGPIVASQIPRRASQLTIQQMEVLWVGNWRDPAPNNWEGPNNDQVTDLLARVGNDFAQLPPELQQELRDYYGFDITNEEVLEELTRARRQYIQPEVVILSMPLQDAITLKWAYEEPGINLDLVLRSQGDNALFVTTSVSLPQLVEQAGLTIPEPGQYGLEPAIDLRFVPRLFPIQSQETALVVTEENP